MGTYLSTSIVEKIVIEKYQLKNKLTVEEIANALQNELNLEHYLFGENDEELMWEIKPQMLIEGNLVEFLEAQFEMYGGVEKEHAKRLFNNIKKATSAKEIIEIAKNGEYHFQLSNISNGMRVHRENGFDKHVSVKYSVIILFLDGKIIMECYKDIFHYFERNIRLQKEKYPLASCVKAMITN